MKKVDIESLQPPPKFQVNIKIQLHASRVSRLSFRFLWLWLHIWLCRRVSDKNFFTRPISGNKTAFFGLKHYNTRVFVFPNPRFFAWPLVLGPNLFLLALASNLCLLTLAPNLHIPALAPKLCLPTLAGTLHLPPLVPNLYLPTLAPAMVPNLHLRVQVKILLLLPQPLVLSLPLPLPPPLLLQLLLLPLPLLLIIITWDTFTAAKSALNGPLMKKSSPVSVDLLI